MKDKYLEDLKRRLEEYDISSAEIEDILSDYAEMIDDAMQKNMTEDEVLNLIGTPRKVVQDLRDQFKKSDYDDDDEGSHHHRKHNNKIVALMPFVSTILFFILGFGFDLWHPGWLVFLLIPVSAIIVNAFDRNIMSGLVALSPFVAVVTFLVIGFTYGVWHPTWLVFLIIPVLGVLTGADHMKPMELITALSPFLVLTAYILIGTYADIWHPTWLLFMLIPFFGILNERVIWKMIVMELALLLAVGGYLFIGYQYDVWTVSGFIFLIPLGVAVILSEDKSWHFDKQHKDVLLLTLTTIVIYFVFGFWLQTWAYLWMIFLLIPMYAIVKYNKDKNTIVALMPFVSTILFFTLGFFFGWWEFSWIAFLLIPIVAILKNA